MTYERKKKRVNPLHEIRMKEKQMVDHQRKKLSSKIDRGLERKRLSSAFTNARKEANNPNNIFNLKSPRDFNASVLSTNVNTKEDEEDEDGIFGRKFHYVHMDDEDVTVTKAFSRVTTAVTTKRDKPLSNTYFVPSLVEICATAIASNVECM